MRAAPTSDDQPHVLMYREAGRFYYLPTDPEAYKWRGPFPFEANAVTAALAELGGDPVVTMTTRRPEKLPA